MKMNTNLMKPYMPKQNNCNANKSTTSKKTSEKKTNLQTQSAKHKKKHLLAQRKAKEELEDASAHKKITFNPKE